jgi:hypothetical protein
MNRKLAATYGMEGGWSCSPAKRAAARANGRKSKGAENNGRPRSRTLGEVILRRKLAPADYRALGEAWIQLKNTEKDWFAMRYGFKPGGYRNVPDMRMRDYRAVGKASAAMQHVLRKMRLVARYELGKK